MSAEAINYSSIKKETEKAILIRAIVRPRLCGLETPEYVAELMAVAEAEAVEMWVPRSVVECNDTEAKTLIVARWWALKNGLTI